MRLNKVLAILIGCLLGVNLYAQTTFTKSLSSLDSDFAVSVAEDDHGNYIFAGFLQDAASMHNRGYAIKLDGNGNLIQSKIFNNTLSTNFSSVHIVDNEYYFIGDERDPLTNSSHIIYLKTDSNLNTLVVKRLGLPTGYAMTLLTGVIDSDTNFVMSCTLSSFSAVQPYTPLLYKISLGGDSINAKIEMFPNDPVNLSPAIPFLIEKKDSSGYIGIGQQVVIFQPYAAFLHYDKDFNLLQRDTILPPVSTSFSPVRVNDNIIIAGRIFGVFPSTKNIQMAVLTDSNQVLFADTIGFPNDESNLPARSRSVSTYNNNTFIGITKDMSFAGGPYGSGNPSWFHITKINPDLTKVWSKTFGGDFYYLMNGIFATKDGGCLAYGTKYDYNTPTNELDLYIIKIDGNGLITFTQEIDLGKINVNVYPNPGVNELNIKSDIKDGKIEVYSIDGKQMLTQKISNNSVNTSQLPQGIYVYKIYERNTLVKSGKWVKK